MVIGLLHTHRTLAYLLFLAALINLVLILARARRDEGTARLVRYSHEIGILWFGRVNILVGLGYVLATGYPLSTWWLWVSVLLWGPVEAMGRRMVKAELLLVEDGGEASSRLTTGAVIELICITLIFGLMSVRPGM